MLKSQNWEPRENPRDNKMMKDPGECVENCYEQAWKFGMNFPFWKDDIPPTGNFLPFLIIKKNSSYKGPTFYTARVKMKRTVLSVTKREKAKEYKGKYKSNHFHSLSFSIFPIVIHPPHPLPPNFSPKIFHGKYHKKRITRSFEGLHFHPHLRYFGK